MSAAVRAALHAERSRPRRAAGHRLGRLAAARPPGRSIDGGGDHLLRARLASPTARRSRRSRPEPLIVVRPTELADLVPGKVLTYQLKSGEPTLVTHRITQRMLLADGSPVFTTKGDANAQPDLAPVKPVQVKGTVWHAIRYLGWVATLLTGESRTVAVSILVSGLRPTGVASSSGRTEHHRPRGRRPEPIGAERTSFDGYSIDQQVCGCRCPRWLEPRLRCGLIDSDSVRRSPSVRTEAPA